MSLWNLLVKKQTRVPNLLMLINTSINFSSTAFKHLNFSPLQLISTRFERKKKKNILFMSIKIYLWKHFQFATYNQSFMIFPRAKARNKFYSLHSWRSEIHSQEVWIFLWSKMRRKRRRLRRKARSIRFHIESAPSFDRAYINQQLNKYKLRIIQCIYDCNRANSQ